MIIGIVLYVLMFILALGILSGISEDQRDLEFLIFLGGVLWPITIIVFISIIPYRLGVRIGKKLATKL